MATVHGPMQITLEEACGGGGRASQAAGAPRQPSDRLLAVFEFAANCIYEQVQHALLWAPFLRRHELAEQLMTPLCQLME